MKASPFFSRATLTNLTICTALCFTSMSSFAGTLTRSSVDTDDESGNTSVFERDYHTSHGRRAYIDSDIWFDQQNTSTRRLRGYAELRDADADSDDWVVSNVFGSVSNTRPITLTGVAASQTKSAAPADPPTPAVPAVPEPATLALFGSGLCGVALTMRRKFRHHY